MSAVPVLHRLFQLLTRSIRRVGPDAAFRNQREHLERFIVEHKEPHLSGLLLVPFLAAYGALPLAHHLRLMCFTVGGRPAGELEQELNTFLAEFPGHAEGQDLDLPPYGGATPERQEVAYLAGTLLNLLIRAKSAREKTRRLPRLLAQPTDDAQESPLRQEQDEDPLRGMDAEEASAGSATASDVVPEGCVLICNPEKLTTRLETEAGDSVWKPTLTQLGAARPLARVSAAMLPALDDLAREQPNFAQALRRIRTALHARLLKGRPVRTPPLLLYGPPGTGKNRLVRRLGEIFSVPVKTLSLAGSSDFLIVTGASRGWRNAAPGMVARGLADSPVANPLFVLDEIDKVYTSQQGSPLDRLLLLLEAESAREFIDDYAEVPLDASHATLIAMANDIEQLPAPLLSRFECIPVAPLDAAGRRVMVATVYRELWRENDYAGLLESEVDAAVVDQLAACGLNGRELKSAIAQAMEQACLALPLDGAVEPVQVGLAHLQLGHRPGPGRIGFVRERD